MSLKRKITILSSIWFLTFASCGKRYMPGYDYQLFDGTVASALAKAVEKEDTLLIENLIKENPELVNFRENRFGNSLLMLTIVNRNHYSMRTLLKNGANPNLEDYYRNKSSMMLACSFIGTDDCNLDVIQLLVQKYDGNVNSIQIVDTIEKGHRVVFNRSLLMSTIDDIGCLNIVKYLVEQGADVDYSGGEGYRTALNFAVNGGEFDIVKYLLLDCNAEIPDIFDIGFYDNQPNQKVGFIECLERAMIQNPQKMKEILEVKNTYLLKKP